MSIYELRTVVFAIMGMIVTILSPNLSRKWKVICCSLVVIVSYCLFSEFAYFDLLVSVAVIGAIALIILYGLKDTLRVARRILRMDYDCVIYANIGSRDVIIEKYIKELKINLCRMIEDCMYKVNCGRFAEAAQVFRGIIDIIDLLQENRSTYYLRFAVAKYDRNLSSFLNKESKSLKTLPSLIQNNSQNMLGLLEGLIDKIYHDYRLDRFNLARSRMKEFRDEFRNRSFQYDRNSMPRMNFELWKKYFPCETPTSVFFFFMSSLYVFSLLILLKLHCPFTTFIFPALFLFVLIVIPRFIVTPDIHAISWAKGILEQSFQEKNPEKRLLDHMKTFLKEGAYWPNERGLMRHTGLFIKTSGVVENMNELDQINDQFVKKLNYCFLLYFLTTFPNKRINNFKPLCRGDLTDPTKNLECEEIDRRDFCYSLRQWKNYSVDIVHLGWLKKKLGNLLSLLVGKLVTPQETEQKRE